MLTCLQTQILYDVHPRFQKADAWRYDFNKVTLAATVVYTYIGLMPVLLWGVLKYFNSTGNTPPSLLDIITVYGYSLFVYIPVAIICIFPWIGK